MTTDFRNEPFTDFSKEENAAAMRAALEQVKAELGREYPLVIGGERINTNAKLDSINPANRTQVVGRFQKATKELANDSTINHGRVPLDIQYPPLSPRNVNCSATYRFLCTRFPLAIDTMVQCNYLSSHFHGFRVSCSLVSCSLVDRNFSDQNGRHLSSFSRPKYRDITKLEVK